MSKLGIAVSIICMGGGILLAESLPPDGWRVPISLVTADYTQRYSDIATTGDNVHVIWADDREGYCRLYYKKSTDNGFTWSGENPISQEDEVVVGEKRNICIAASEDQLYVVYSVDMDGDYSIMFCRSTNNGGTWEGYETIDDELSTLPQPSISVADDSIRVAYCDEPDIVYVASGNNGNTWHSYDHLNFGEPELMEWPDIITINNRPHIACVATYRAWAYARHLGTNWELSGWIGATGDTYNNSRIVADNSGNLCMVFDYVKVIEQPPNPTQIWRSLWCSYSTDGGDNWEWGFIFQPTVDGGPENHDIIHDSDEELMLVYGKYPDGDLWGCVSTDFGANWGDEFELADGFGGGEAPAFALHPSLIKNTISKHVVFERWVAGNFDLAYMAMDDLLLSDTPEATAFNCGIHLVRDIFNSSLHLTYQSQYRVHYAFSSDDGGTWSPYHIIEDPQTGQKEYGEYPAIGLNPGFFTCDPCLVFIDSANQVKYRYRDLCGDWQGFTILPYVGLEPGPPALATYGGDVFVAFSVMNWLGSEDYVSAVLFYQFSSAASEPPEPVILDQANDARLCGSMVCVTVDGDGNPHVAWSKKPTINDPEDIFYRWRDGDNWEDIEPVSEQTNAPSIFPHIDNYGDWLAVVWHYDGDYEIWRRCKQISENQWDPYPGEYSQQYAVCAYPVNAGVDFSVWCEAPAVQSDIRYRSDTYGWGWVSQAEENEYFCHSSLQRDYTPWDLYTIFTRGDEIPYRIVCVHQQFGGGGGSESVSAFYTVKTGKDTTSAFCTKRDTAITYENYSIDYAANELSYNLSLLEPPFPYHLIKGTAYYEGSDKKTQELWINGQKKFTFVVNAHKPIDFEIPIPLELYKQTHKVNLSIKNPQGTGVYLASLKIYRLIDSKPFGGSGGPQSAGSDPLVSQVRLVLTPNPFSKLTKISFGIGQSAKSIKLRIYDVSGRLMKSFNLRSEIGHHESELYWDGCDDSGRQLPSGIYFIELKSGNESITEKVIMLK